jgi:serine/threonine-protein kinase
MRSLAVLPFAAAANDEDAEYLGDGITDSLIRRMSQLGPLRVMARSTVANFKGKAIDPGAVGRQLAVDAVLVGTVARRSGRLHITTELVEVATGARMWSASYDRAPADVLLIQDEIASAIIDEGIKLRLTGDERRRLVRHSTESAEAYDLYVRALSCITRETEEDYLKARGLLQQAVARDTRFALAYRALATTYTVMAIDGFERPTEAWPHANRHTERALECDPDLAEAQAESATEAFFFNWNWALAERKWKIAMESPRGHVEPDLLLGYALERWALGRTDQALQLAREARQIDPITTGFKIREADLLLHLGQLDAAAALYTHGIESDPSDPRAHFGLAETRRLQRRFAEAIEARHRGHAAAQDDSIEEVFASARGEDGYRHIEVASARLQLEALEARASKAYASPLDFARLHALLGHRDESFRFLDAAFDDRAPGLVFLNVDRTWNGMRDDPRFVAAVHRVGLTGA